MIIRGPRLEDNFSVIDNRVINDRRLTWVARAVLIFLLSKPANWRVSVEALKNETKDTRLPTGRDGVYAALGELVDAGYVQRSQSRGDDGRVKEYDYIVSEIPLPAKPETAEPLPAEPLTANPTLQRTEENKELMEQSAGEEMTTLPASLPTICGTPKKKKVVGGSARFQSFWDLWPADGKAQRKVDKAGCLRIWERDGLEAEADQILAALAVLKQSEDWTKDGGKFRPQTKTFLNQRRWTGIAKDDGTPEWVKEAVDAELLEQGLPPRYTTKIDPKTDPFYVALMNDGGI